MFQDIDFRVQNSAFKPKSFNILMNSIIVLMNNFIIKAFSSIIALYIKI